ncbi:MAG: 3-phenylpropionate/cinnamic acid dioxygenase subunit beta [Burkholderiaceae bacterium]
MSESSAPDSLRLWWRVLQFLHLEADLLDERRYEEWLALLDEQIHYRVPIARNVRRDRIASEYTAEGEIAWFDEGIATLRQRVAQIRTGVHWAEEPVSRFSHLVTNVRVLDTQPLPDGAQAVRVRSRFLVSQNRLQTENQLLAGKRQDTLRVTPERILLVKREVFLDQSVLLAKALTTFF